MRRPFATFAFLAASACASGGGRERMPPPPPRPDLLEPAARLDLRRIDVAVRDYASERAGRLPASLDALVGERSPTDGRPYLADVPRDPWGRPYSYAVVSSRDGVYDLRSYGADTLPGTGDDVEWPSAPVPLR